MVKTREDGGLDQMVGEQQVKSHLDSGTISKEVFTGLADGLEVWSKRKSRIVDLRRLSTSKS